jgi:hypothetical protein
MAIPGCEENAMLIDTKGPNDHIDSVANRFDCELCSCLAESAAMDKFCALTTLTITDNTANSSNSHRRHHHQQQQLSWTADSQCSICLLSVQLEKLSQTRPQATVSRWNFFTRSPPESASRTGMRRISCKFRKTSIWDLPSSRFVPKIDRFESRLFVLRVFERYHLFFFAETAHLRPLGPKREGNLVNSGKLQYGICRVTVSFESYSRYESL